MDSLLAEKLGAEMVGLTAVVSEFLRADLKVLYWVDGKVVCSGDETVDAMVGVKDFDLAEWKVAQRVSMLDSVLVDPTER